MTPPNPDIQNIQTQKLVQGRNRLVELENDILRLLAETKADVVWRLEWLPFIGPRSLGRFLLLVFRQWSFGCVTWFSDAVNPKPYTVVGLWGFAVGQGTGSDHSASAPALGTHLHPRMWQLRI